MSAGAFTNSKYQATYGGGTPIHPIRVQDTTLALTKDGDSNDPPSGDVSNPISAAIGNTRREYGLRPRYVVLKTPATGGPSGYQPGGLIRVPILTATFFGNLNKGDAVTYLGATFSVVSTESERVV